MTEKKTNDELVKEIAKLFEDKQWNRKGRRGRCYLTPYG